MATRAAETPATRRNNDYTVEFSGETESLSDYFFGFSSADGLQTPESSCESGDGFEDEEDDSCPNADEKREFWNSQEQLLKGTLCRTSSIEAKIRHATKESMNELISGGFRCGCRNQNNIDCRSCLRSEVCNSLLQKGFCCAICKSKWRSSPEIPSGEHTFLEVVDRSNLKKGEIRVIIELNFRAEFEMAKGSSEYNQLTARLPEVFVGKEERLRSVIKVVCAAAKRCMKEKKIHIGPWRKHKYMKAKWLGKCERSIPTPAALPVSTSVRPRRPKASLLTFDLVEKLPDYMQCTAVKVV